MSSILPQLLINGHGVSILRLQFCSLRRYAKSVNKTYILQDHWNTWVTEENLQSLSNAGITHVRIPIGYWMVMDQAECDYYQEPWILGDYPYLVKALQWVKKYNLQGKRKRSLIFVAIIDMHAAPGSQNPWQHR